MSTHSFLDDDDDTLSSVPPSPPQSPTATQISPATLPVQSLVAGRVRRSNAGNLLAKLLTQEADAEDTLFLEDEDDVEFFVKKEDRADDDDALMDSSSDEDEGAAEQEGEQDEEKEIALAEKEARKARKRKADDAFLRPRKNTVPRKERRVTIREARVGVGRRQYEDEGAGEDDEMGDEDASSRPRKKSERISWVPEFVATRASSRTLSLQNRSETMRRLEESEKRRLHTIALMERAAAKKEKVRPKREMTQEERLEEAKITERRNRRSLFSWEETEKAKLEEQRERLAALRNRKLAGPVITYWSGAAEWSAQTGRLVKVGRGLVQEAVEVEPAKKTRPKKKGKEKEKEKEKGADENIGATQTDAAASSGGATIVLRCPPSPETSKPPTTAALDPAASTVTATSTATKSPKKEANTFPVFIDGVADVAVKEDAAPLETVPLVPPQKMVSSAPDENMPLPPQETPRTPPPPPPPNEVSTRNLIVLENFGPSAVRDKASLVKVLWGEQTKRLGISPSHFPSIAPSFSPAFHRFSFPFHAPSLSVFPFPTSLHCLLLPLFHPSCPRSLPMAIADSIYDVQPRHAPTASSRNNPQSSATRPRVCHSPTSMRTERSDGYYTARYGGAIFWVRTSARLEWQQRGFLRDFDRNGDVVTGRAYVGGGMRDGP